MEGHDDISTQSPEVASIGQSDTCNDESDTQRPLSTDTTVKRRSSASSTHLQPTTTQQTEAFIEPFPEEGLPAAPEEPAVLKKGTEVNEDATRDTDGPAASEDNMQLRQSARSMGSFDEEDHSTITLRSRSDSSGTFSSSDGSAQVDWDELEKEEGQAPRDEGSDEVSSIVADRQLHVSC